MISGTVTCTPMSMLRIHQILAQPNEIFPGIHTPSLRHKATFHSTDATNRYISTRIYSPILSSCSLHTNSGCGKRRRILVGPWRPAKATFVQNYLEVYWACAGKLSAVNAIGMQLRNPINSGLTRFYFAVRCFRANSRVST